MSNPDETTSNYAWSLWHLEQAKIASSITEAQTHATLAQARATLALVDQRVGDSLDNYLEGLE